MIVKGALSSGIIDALQTHPHTVLVHVRRYPASQSPGLQSREPELRFGDRYIAYGFIFGNGAKNGAPDPRWRIGALWQVNVTD